MYLYNSATHKKGIFICVRISLYTCSGLELSKIISSHKSNDTITLSVVRNGNQKGEIKATLANSNDQF